MYSSSTLSSERWTPDHHSWSEEAFEETRDAFFQTVVESPHQHAQAFALWALSLCPELEDAAVADFQGGCPDGSPMPEDVERARSAIDARSRSERDQAGVNPVEGPGGDEEQTAADAPSDAASDAASESAAPAEEAAPKPRKRSKRAASKKSKRLSSVEKSVLAELEQAERLIADYHAAEKALQTAIELVEAAEQSLRDMDPLARDLLCRHDESAAELLQRVDQG